MAPPVGTVLAGLLAAAVLGACVSSDDVRLGATTTIADSGLLDELVDDFERATGRRVRATVQGTGSTLDLARRGEVDAVFVHEPVQERAFVAAGHGERRTLVMYNEFVLVGPPSDPAGARGKTIEEAFRSIAARGATFITRGDRSGTDVMERSLWPRAGVTPGGSWYVESGVGQGQTLIVASERSGYTIVDRGTYLSQRGRVDLEILVEPEPPLPNLYHVIAVAASGADRAAADAWIVYVTSPRAQDLIGRFGVDRHGAPLFTPAAGRTEDEVR